MSRYDLFLLGAAVIVALLSWGNWRALGWLSVTVANYLVTSAYADLGLPSHAFFTMLVDAAVIAGVAQAWRTRGLEHWEALFGYAFLFMVAGDVFRQLLVLSADAYRLWLELGNYAALLAIGGPRIAEYVSAGLDQRGYRNRHLRRLHLYLASPWLARWPVQRWRA